ncbi:MAG: type II secretion system F family protein [Gemmatirosa sp.]
MNELLHDSRAILALAIFGTIVAVASLAGAGAVMIAWRGHSAIMDRLSSRSIRRAVRGARGADDETDAVLAASTPRWRQQLVAWLDAWVPESLTTGDIADRLSRAGMHGADAVLLYALARVVALPLGFVLTLPLIGGPRGLSPMMALAIAIVFGVMAPSAVLDRLIARRQAAIRASLPDALDLLVVCMEAGVGLDAGMLRVARELEPVHPDLSEELTVANRRVGAGLPREEAMRGMYVRTGIDELRSLATTMVQAERLGTSLGRVLRIYADGLRIKRRQHAAARASEASVKMIFPLVTLLLPAFFAVVLGPAVLSLSSSFGGQ